MMSISFISYEDCKISSIIRFWEKNKNIVVVDVNLVFTLHILE